MISNSLIETMKAYFGGKTSNFKGIGLVGIEAEPSTYVWPKTSDGVKNTDLIGLNSDLSGSKYQQNIALKKQLPELWENGDKRFIAEWIVKNWGGIKGNRKSTLDNYVSIIENNIDTDNHEGFGDQIKGIASYSKILMAINPKKYAIYDARVAVSLNAIQLLDKTENSLAFNYLSGRNKITGDVSSKPKRGFSTIDEYKVHNLVTKNGWGRIARNKTYRVYLDLLHQVKHYFPEYELYHLEMALFADAEALACRVEPLLRWNSNTK